MTAPRDVPLEAHEWWVNGDHPADRVNELLTDEQTGLPYRREEGKVVRRFNRPDIPRPSPCLHCHYPASDHGWIDYRQGYTVCPGDVILTGREPGEYYPCKPDLLLFARWHEKATGE